MAYNLTAMLKLNDVSFSRGMKGASKQVNLLSSATNSAKRSVSGLTSGMAAAAAGVLTVVGAQKALNATIGEAMKLDYNKVSLQAMFSGDAKAADELSKFIQDKAINSVMSYQDVLSSTQSFTTLTKNTDQIKDMVKLDRTPKLLKSYARV